MGLKTMYCDAKRQESVGAKRKWPEVSVREASCQVAVNKLRCTGTAVVQCEGVTTRLVNRYARSEGWGDSDCDPRVAFEPASPNSQTEQIRKRDGSGGGGVAAYDAALIAQRAVGLISKFPVEPEHKEGDMRKIKISGIFLALFFSVLFFTHDALAANHYIRQGATGTNNGSDWANAYTNLPSALTRGDTYYIAGGSYGGYTFDDSASGTSLITIKKATVSDHGTDTGWNDTYANGQAIFSNWSMRSSYILIDGQTGGGPGQWETGLGIKVTHSGTSALFDTGANTNVTLQHIEFDGQATGNAMADYGSFSLSGATTNLAFRYSYIHDLPCDIFKVTASQTGLLLEYNKLSRNYQGTACHGDVFETLSGTQSNWVSRYNWFDNVVGTYVWGSNGPTLDSAAIYGNLLTDGVYDNGIVAGLSSGGTVSNLRFYNNTIANPGGYQAGFANLRGSGNVAYNNLWYGGSASLSVEGTHDYNWFYGVDSQSESHGQNGSGNPFTNSAGKDFTLKAATNAGMSLSAPYNMDAFGNTRGSGGVWDRGAYEYVSGSSSTAPTAPTGLVLR